MFLYWLSIVLAVLKLLGIISISWFVVLIPAIAMAAATLFMWLVFGGILVKAIKWTFKGGQR